MFNKNILQLNEFFSPPLFPYCNYFPLSLIIQVKKKKKKGRLSGCSVSISDTICVDIYLIRSRKIVVYREEKDQEIGFIMDYVVKKNKSYVKSWKFNQVLEI